VKGDGYTNHCPVCLWSKHVDNNPGDRQNECQGSMKPIEAFFKKQSWYIKHKCQKCNEKKVIKFNKKDNLDVLEKILKKRKVG
jgi:RNHCP domain